MFKQNFDIKAYTEYRIISILLLLSKTVPKKWLYSISLFFVKRHYEKKSARLSLINKNLHMAFPKLDNVGIDKLSREFLLNYSFQLCETLLLLTNRIDYSDMIVNLDEVKKQMAQIRIDTDRGIVFILGHFGNWEMVGHLLGDNGLSLILISKGFKNRYVNDNILVPFRTKTGNISIGRNGAMITIGRAMKRGGVTGLLIDQMIPPPNGVEILFFGEKTYATKSIAQIKLKFNPEVIPLFSVREGVGKFRVEFGKPVEYIAKEALDKEDKIQKMTQYYANILEEKIASTPAQWQWSYDRWRIS